MGPQRKKPGKKPGDAAAASAAAADAADASQRQFGRSWENTKGGQEWWGRMQDLMEVLPAPWYGPLRGFGAEKPEMVEKITAVLRTTVFGSIPGVAQQAVTGKALYFI